MASGALLLYHLGVLLFPLAALAFLRFRLTPALLLLAVLHHHPMEPMPGDHDPPICCLLAQSVEADPESAVTAVRSVRLPPPSRSSVPGGTRTVKPAIRAPPHAIGFPPPAPCAPAFRAA